MTVPDPHAPSPVGSPLTRRAARRERERLAHATTPTDALPAAPPSADPAARIEHSGPVEDAQPATLPLDVIVDWVAPEAPGWTLASHPPIFKPSLPPPLPTTSRRTPARHVRRRRGRALAGIFSTVAAAALVLGGTSAATVALAGPPTTIVADDGDSAATAPLPELKAGPVVPGPGGPGVAVSRGLPAVPAGEALCATPAFTQALAAHNDADAIAAAGGAEAFRTAVASGTATCVPMADPTHVWVVVNKQRPYEPIDYAPTPMTLPAGVRSLEGGELRSDASTALSQLVTAARTAGVGEIALESGYRSYTTQVTSYGNQVSARGADQADLVSARPGFSEHQSGLAGDVVACDGGCGTLDDLAHTAQGSWIAAHAWEYGWIVRYEAGHTPVSGYLPEPWHLRFIGTDLSKAYHDGGYHTLEEFFGLPAAPDYAD